MGLTLSLFICVNNNTFPVIVVERLKLLVNYNFHHLLARGKLFNQSFLESGNQLTRVGLLLLNRERILTCFQPYFNWKDIGNTSPIEKALRRMNKTHIVFIVFGESFTWADSYSSLI